MLSTYVEDADRPVYLLNAPLSLSADEPNNDVMRELAPEQRVIDRGKALDQWNELYAFLASQGLVYLVPSVAGLQDQVFVANLALRLHHLHGTVVVSNFRSPPRMGETPVGYDFFKTHGFETVIAPPYFEGEADLKYLRDNIYLGAHGIRSSIEALDWFRETYDMDVVPVELTDGRLYHLDCVLFPLTPTHVMLCPDFLGRETVARIERVAEIVPIPLAVAGSATTNCVRSGDTLLSDSHIETLSASDPSYAEERAKLDVLETIASRYGFEFQFFNLSEFDKSGAALSCHVMHLARGW